MSTASADGRLSPQLRNLKIRKVLAFENAEVYPALASYFGTPANAISILDHWEDLLQLSRRKRSILKKLASSSKPSLLAKALRKVRRLESSLFMIEWYSSINAAKSATVHLMGRRFLPLVTILSLALSFTGTRHISAASSSTSVIKVAISPTSF
ncbi:Tn3 transposase DDE domain protein [Pseudovibrio sp. Ad14]|nr:Tn3 transposase DDE domain protein [Pseudovibrio sp. W74]KZL11593.1 Tn3 transposase DDE domain protein [Pseudovibrio sp. Ad14]